MRYRDVKAMPGSTLTELQDTSRVSRCNHPGLDRGNVSHFSIQEALSRVGMHKIVDAGTAATPVAFGHFQKLQLRDLLQHGAGLLADFLCV